MAGFDYENQRTAQMPNMKVNGGTFDFSGGVATIDVPTTLAKVFGSVCAADLTATTSVQQTMLAYRVGDVSNGFVSFLRGGGFIDQSAHMSYWMWGY